MVPAVKLCLPRLDQSGQKGRNGTVTLPADVASGQYIQALINSIFPMTQPGRNGDRYNLQLLLSYLPEEGIRIMPTQEGESYPSG